MSQAEAPRPWRLDDRPRPIPRELHRGKIRFIEVPPEVRAEIEARELARRSALAAPGRAGPDPAGDDQAVGLEQKPGDG